MRTTLASLVAIVILFGAASQSDAACLSLTADLSQGSQGTSVTSLQSYLVTWGYLSVAPTGYFGPATFAAVKKYQSIHGVSPTGYVGPLTRATINTASCAAGTPTTSASTQTPTTVSTPVVSTPVTISSTVSTPVTTTTATNPNAIVVTAPGSNETITSGKNYTIQWTGPSTGSYNILLEDSSGVGKGFIATNLYHVNSYVWKSGDVTTTSSDSSWDPVLPTGTYRIHVVDSIAGPQTSDQVSPNFAFVSTPLAITSISPSYVTSNATAANPTTVTLYGTGFDRTTQVTLQGAFTSSVYPSYIYPDGNELVFSVPAGLASGRYSVGISNTYGSFSSSGVTLNVSN